MLPASWLVAPYNFLTSMMRKDLKDTNTSTTQITTQDFTLVSDDLDKTWDIFVIATKR
jgi:hypothetical protein